jgi:ABC-type glycerol-3-phosphate transport system substrate-binding protein
MKKKLLALVLACAMALGLAACGGSKAETPAGNNGMTPPRHIWWVSAS